ncbi:hypothetical protein BJV77DRAFT_1031880 [Russula vinacea]|nr:hypothetical protein BJV77DRAFT_1031880 [Russula vinacea]
MPLPEHTPLAREISQFIEISRSIETEYEKENFVRKCVDCHRASVIRTGREYHTSGDCIETYSREEMVKSSTLSGLSM